MSDPAHTDLHQRINDWGNRVIDGDKELAEADAKIDKRVERLIAQGEETGRNVVRLEEHIGKNAEAIAEIVIVQQQTIEENKIICKQVSEANTTAIAAQVTAEHVESITRPLIDQKKRRMSIKDAIIVLVVGTILSTGILALIAYAAGLFSTQVSDQTKATKTTVIVTE